MTDTAAPLPRRTPGDMVRRAMLAEGATHGLTGAVPLDWIGYSGASVADALIAWSRGNLVEVPAGRAWDVVTLPAQPGRETVNHLRGMGAALGPILYRHKGGDVSYFVAPGAANGWDLAGARVLPAGRMVALPHPSVVAPRQHHGYSWLVPPHGAGHLTDGSDLYGAYAAALTTPTAVTR